MKCNRLNCDNEARWQLGWRAWALGYPKSSHPPIDSYIGLAVCDEHKREVTIDWIVTPEGAAQINQVMASRRLAPLDFKNAEPIFHELVDGKLYMGPKA